MQVSCLKLSAIGLWPAVLLHAALTLWCVVCLRRTNARGPGGTAREAPDLYAVVLARDAVVDVYPSNF